MNADERQETNKQMSLLFVHFIVEEKKRLPRKLEQKTNTNYLLLFNCHQSLFFSHTFFFLLCLYFLETYSSLPQSIGGILGRYEIYSFSYMLTPKLLGMRHHLKDAESVQSWRPPCFLGHLWETIQEGEFTVMLMTLWCSELCSFPQTTRCSCVFTWCQLRSPDHWDSNEVGSDLTPKAVGSLSHFQSLEGFWESVAYISAGGLRLQASVSQSN